MKVPSYRQFLDSLKPSGPLGQQIPEDGRWLSAKGTYRDYIAAYCKVNPNLRSPDPKNRFSPLRCSHARVAMLEIEQGKQVHRTDFTSAEDLSSHLKHSYRPSVSRIYIMEGLAHDFIAVLGEHFLLMDPSFFMGQERTTRWGLSLEGSSNTPELPSLIDSERVFAMRYYEPRKFLEINTFSMWCARTSRNISVTRNTRPDLYDLKYEPVGIVHRKCSFWSQKNDGESWDAVILCDPPVEQVLMQRDNINTDSNIRSKYSRWMPDKPIPQSAPNTSFSGGYLDFIKHREFGSNTPKGPPRISMLEDLCFYWTEYGNKIAENSGPAIASLFMLKIVASNYMLLLEFARASVANLEFQMSRRDNLKNIHVPWIEEQWSDLQAWSWRCTEYIENVEAILIHLGVPFSAPIDRRQKEDWKSCDKDFQYVHYRLKSLKTRVDLFMNSITGLAGIAGTRHALLEARRSFQETVRIKTLTLLGMIFLPLSFCTGIFSMNDNYLPGTSSFWIYFAVSVPLITVVFLLTFLVALGYDDDGKWSIKTFMFKVSKLKISC